MDSENEPVNKGWRISQGDENERNTTQMHIMSKLRESAKDQLCTLNIAGVCNYKPETVILSHLPSEYKGMGNKSLDYCACFSCSSCHDVIDSRVNSSYLRETLSREDKEFYMRRAMLRTWAVWIEDGLIEIK